MKAFISTLVTILALLLLSATALALPTGDDEITLLERQTGCLGSVPCVSLDGDGDPHQWILHKQLSPAYSCANGQPCEVPQTTLFGEQIQTSYTLTADAHGVPWTAGGFDVSESVETGTTAGCWSRPGPGIDGNVCVVAVIWFSDYMVKVGFKNNCFPGCDTSDKTAIIRSPNTINNGVEYWCAPAEACAGGKGSETWFQGPAGGPPSQESLADAALVERQTGCMGSSPCVVLDGDGNPHQQILHKQLSQWIVCGGTNCGLSDNEKKSYTLNADFHGLPFTTGGFDVSQFIETGSGPDCSAGPGQRVCVWGTFWWTDFTLKSGTRNQCIEGCHTSGGSTIVHAPNTLNRPVEYYCAYDSACGDQGQEYWITGPAMGPPAPPALDKRQMCVPSGTCTSVEGNGDPHQWILHKQIGINVSCDDTVVCTIPSSQQHGVTLHANTHGLDWISGGFDVAQSVDIPAGPQCYAGAGQPGNTACTMVVAWHTDYTVRGGVATSCALDGCQEYPDTTIIRSPNQIHNGVEYYCAYDHACGDLGSEFWIGAQAGGPP